LADFIKQECPEAVVTGQTGRTGIAKIIFLAFKANIQYKIFFYLKANKLPFTPSTTGQNGYF